MPTKKTAATTSSRVAHPAFAIAARKLLSTVPAAVRHHHAEHMSAAHWDSDIANRLVYDSNMKSVWARLSALAPIGDDLTSTLYLTAGLLPGQWACVPIISAAKAIASLEGIGKAASRLADRIMASGDALSWSTGSIDLIILIRSALRNRSKTHQLTTSDQKVVRTLINISKELGPNGLPELHELLHAVGDTINPMHIELPRSFRPQKPGDPEAYRTFVSRELSSVFERHDVAIPFEIVATMTNVIVDDPDLRVTSDHVRKNVSSAQSYKRKPRKL